MNKIVKINLKKKFNIGNKKLQKEANGKINLIS